ncbi:MAG: pyruvate formate lyase family protein, partial [Opitutaceae bacterium]|nr:pyruvate formate lyase family protein [Opitutaceae bacterium]
MNKIDHSIAAALELRPLHAPWDATPPLSLELALTDIARRHENSPASRREAAILRVQLPAMFQPMRPGDTLAGRPRLPLVGLSPELMGIGLYCLEKPIRQILANAPPRTLTAAHRRRVEDMLDYWRPRTTHARIRAARDPHTRRHLSEDDWFDHPGSAFPLYRIAGTNLDYTKLLRTGLPQLIRNLETEHAATRDTLQTLLDITRRHAAEARALADADETAAAPRAPETRATATALDALTRRPPRTLREAIQLAWLATLASGTVNYGRMDIWLAPWLDNEPA